MLKFPESETTGVRDEKKFGFVGCSGGLLFVLTVRV
jgi:hypothetical protein